MIKFRLKIFVSWFSSREDKRHVLGLKFDDSFFLLLDRTREDLLLINGGRPREHASGERDVRRYKERR